ncbi:Protein-lysine N-methyltransferase EEF2KMT [Orchesella cincta]|uniref:Protein-lysine N-methyltransferase EEF2KMT n=1 Tax=Orchesella cincta TaxID=48709 RepID=A0A1D2MUA4_ORCCI|nr:Protein-lysine N-methyltransferase EEF2KMT [Orchesella cincta]
MDQDKSLIQNVTNAGQIRLPHIQLVFSQIHEEYLRAVPPQQMKELKKLFQNVTPLAPILSEPTISPNTTTEKDLEDNCIGFGKELTSCSASTSGEISEGNSGTVSSVIMLIMLYDVTLGYRAEMEAVDESFTQPPIQYRIAFAKYVIKQLESGDWKTLNGYSVTQQEAPEENEELETVSERWYEGLEEISSRHVLSEPFYRLYEIEVPCGDDNRKRRKDIVKIFENESSFVADGTTGLVTWEASVEFIKWFTGEGMTSSCDVKMEETRWILELGCGCGFLAVAVTKCIPCLENYIATDGSQPALEKAKHNVDANFSNDNDKNILLRKKVSFEKVDWQEETRESFTQMVDGMTSINGTNSGLLLGADIVFDPELLPDLVELITKFVEVGAGKVLMSCTIRNKATMGVLMKTLVAAGLSTVTTGQWKNGEIFLISQADK